MNSACLEAFSFDSSSLVSELKVSNAITVCRWSLPCLCDHYLNAYNYLNAFIQVSAWIVLVPWTLLPGSGMSDTMIVNMYCLM